MSRTLFSTSVKSPKSFARASAASTEFWAACSKRTKNSLFLGRRDRRTGVLLWPHILRHLDRRRESDDRRDGVVAEDELPGAWPAMIRQKTQGSVAVRPARPQSPVAAAARRGPGPPRLVRRNGGHRPAGPP